MILQVETIVDNADVNRQIKNWMEHNLPRLEEFYPQKECLDILGFAAIHFAATEAEAFAEYFEAFIDGTAENFNECDE